MSDPAAPVPRIWGLRLGPLLMLAAGLCFALMVSAVKIARAEVSAVEVVAWRGLLSVPLCALVVPRGRWRIHNRPWMAARSVLGLAAMLCYFTAAKGLPVADLTLIGRLQPVALALLAPVLLGATERSDRRIWAVSAAGILGCGLLRGPSLAVGNTAGLWALGAVLTAALAHLCLRRLGATEDSQTVVFWFQAFVSVAAFGALALSAGGLPSLPPPGVLPWLLAVGAGAALFQNLISRAYQLDRVAPVAAASHATPLFGVLIDLVVFATVPGPAVLAGGALLLGAALALVLMKERP